MRQQELIAFSNCHICDVDIVEESGTHTIVVRDGLIDDIVRNAQVERLMLSGFQVIDCQQGWAIPGLIDLHVHLCEEPSPTLAPDFRHDEAVDLAVLRGKKHAVSAIRAGITTLRDVGSFEGRSILVRDTVASASVPGPTILTAGQAITIPGGHFASHSKQGKGSIKLRRLVAEQLESGADLIKVMHQPKGFTRKELAAIVVEAHRHGVKAACHAYLPGCVEDALCAGFDTVEHACELTEDSTRLAREQGCVIVPTLVCAIKSFGDQRLSLIEDVEMPDYERWLMMQHRGLVQLFDSGVLVATGTDAGFPPVFFDDLIVEMELFGRLGMTPWRVIQAATSVAAKAAGIEASHGRISKGLHADIVVLKRNPMKELSALHDVALVIKRGQVVANNLIGKLEDYLRSATNRFQPHIVKERII